MSATGITGDKDIFLNCLEVTIAFDVASLIEFYLELINEVDQRSVSVDTRVELLLVAAGARADMGQAEAAIVLLQVPELTKLPKGGPRARLQYAYAALLEQVGRVEESREWMRKAAASDVDGVTDAQERVEETESLAFSEEELEGDAAAEPSTAAD